MVAAHLDVMAAKRFQELIAWQLADELEREVFVITKRLGDLKFRNQIRDAAASGASNIAEGFGRFVPREFARFLRIARGSLIETQEHLQRGQSRGYLNDPDFKRLSHLADRAIGAITRLIRYLDSQPPR